jgi:hypothetical protein
MVQGPTRRELVIAGASAGLAGAGTLLLKRPHAALQAVAQATSAPASLGARLQVLSDTEFASLAAACDRVFPRDDTPGAVDLGVPLYIDRALAGPSVPSWGDGLLTSVARLDADALERFRVPFWQARPADQDTLIAAWSADSEGDKPLFVRHLVVATLEGVLGDPVHGGNLHGDGWRLFGIRRDPYSPSEVGRP